MHENAPFKKILIFWGKGHTPDPTPSWPSAIPYSRPMAARPSRQFARSNPPPQYRPPTETSGSAPGGHLCWILTETRCKNSFGQFTQDCGRALLSYFFPKTIRFVHQCAAISAIAIGFVVRGHRCWILTETWRTSSSAITERPRCRVH